MGQALDAYPGVDLGARLGIPTVWSLHESFELAHWWAALYETEDAHPVRARERAEEALRNAETLVFAAEATRRLYEPHAPAERMVILPYGLELEAIDSYREEADPVALRERLGIAPGATVLLSLGTVEPRKGQAVLAQAFMTVAGRHPDAVLVIVGDLGGEYSDALHDYLDRAVHGDRVRIEPLAADPYAWHTVADLFVLSSDIESSPIVVLEAMAFRHPGGGHRRLRGPRADRGRRQRLPVRALGRGEPGHGSRPGAERRGSGHHRGGGRAQGARAPRPRSCTPSVCAR